MTPNELKDLLQSSTVQGTLLLNSAALGDPEFTAQATAAFGSSQITVKLTAPLAMLGAIARIKGTSSFFGLPPAVYDISLNVITAAVQLSFEGDVPPASFGNVIESLTGGRFTTPGIAKFTTEAAHVKLAVSGREVVLSISTSGGIFDRIQAQARRDSHRLEYIVLLHVKPEDALFSRFIDALAPLDAFVPRDVNILLASAESAADQVRNLTLPPGVSKLEPGAILVGQLPMDGDLLGLIRRLLGIDSMPLRLSLGPVKPPDVELQSPELPDIDVLPGLMTLSHGVITVHPAAPPEIAIEGQVQIRPLNLPLLRGRFAVAPGRVTVEVGTAEPWRNPFGIARLEVRNVTVQGEIIPDQSIVIAGAIALSTRDATKVMSVVVRFTDGVPSMLAGSFNEAITILDIIETFFGSTGIPDIFSIVQLRDVELSVVPPPLPVVINGVTYEVGFFFKATLLVLGLSGKCSIRVDPVNGLDARAELSRIDLLGLIVISGPSAAGGPILALRDRRSPFLELSGNASIFGLQQSIVAEVRSDGFTVNVHESLGIVEADASCAVGDGSAEVDADIRFIFSADIGPINVPGTDISMGTIHIGDTGFEGRLRAGVAGGALHATLAGSFSLLGMSFTVAEFDVSGDLRTLEDLPRLLIAEIEREAAQIFAAILGNADRWIQFLTAGLVKLAEGIARVLFEVFHKAVDAVAQTLKDLGTKSEDIVRELSAIGVNPEGLVTVLVQIGELPIDAARSIVENVLGVQIPHVDIHADHHFDIHADVHVDVPLPHIDVGHADVHFDIGHVDIF